MNGLYSIVFSACCILCTVRGTDPTDSGTLSSHIPTTLENSVPTSQPDESITTNQPTLEGSTQKMTQQAQGMTTNMFGSTKSSQGSTKSSPPTETTESAVNMTPKIPALAKSMEASTYSTNSDVGTSTEAVITTSTTSPPKGLSLSTTPDQVASTQKIGAEDVTTKPAMETSPVLNEVHTSTQPATTPTTTTEANVPVTAINPIQKIPTKSKTPQVQVTTTTTTKPTNQSPDDEKSLAPPINTSILLIVIPTILFHI